MGRAKEKTLMVTTVKKEINFDCLVPYQKRRFVPENADLTNLDEIRDLYARLSGRDIHSSEELESWVLDRSELETALDQKAAILYIRMTCQTDDVSRAQSYKHFIEHIVPEVKPLDDQLNKKYLDALGRFSLNEDRYGIYSREIRTDIELFVEKNIGLQTELDLLSQDYQAICGAMTVEFDGQERTLPEMGKFLLEPDRVLRERAWRASAQRRLKEKTQLNSLFDSMVSLRDKVAQNAGFDNFCQYRFKSLHRFDYSPRHCQEYHNSIEKLVVPLWNNILQRRKALLKVDVMRPWDTAVDPLGRPPLKPFTDIDELIGGCAKIFHGVDPELGDQFVGMVQAGLLDLASRKGKAPGGYQSTLNEARKPFIFMNAVGIDMDVRTLLHEGGHAFHALACSHDPLLNYRHGPMEFNEVASMGMELLAERYLNAFYNEADSRRSSITHLEDIIFTLVWVATVDAFQHWIYEHPRHNETQRRAKWLEIRKRFGEGVVDWSGLEEEHAHLWHRQLHIFEAPFYYIEYGIAQLGALQLWLNSKNDWGKAVSRYRQALSLGGSRPLPELFATAGLRFDFSDQTIAPLVKALQKELDRINP
jgi:oligoendopeptidase F